jgi:hypothetical protein
MLLLRTNVNIDSRARDQSVGSYISTLYENNLLSPVGDSDESKRNKASYPYEQLTPKIPLGMDSFELL